MNIKQGGGETLDGFRKRIRVAIDNLSLAGGDGVIQPNMTGTGLVKMVDTGMAEEFVTMFFLYQADQRTFRERLLVYEQQDEDGYDSAFPKKVGNAYKVYIHHQSRQGNRYSRGYRYGRQFLQPGGQGGQEVTDIVRGTNGKIWTVKCNKCNKWGHAEGHCP
eukprot:7956734-Ditylum_brightwellii.AAC.1